MPLQIVLGLLRNASILPVGPVSGEDCQPIQDIVLRSVEIKDFQMLRFKFITIGKTVPVVRAGPFLCELQALGCVKTIAIVICLLAPVKLWHFNDVV